MHALRAVQLAQGKTGGGLAAYAERTGYGKSYISQLRSAAEVARVYSSKPANLDDKAKHLYEISKAPRQAWAMLVDRLVGAVQP